MKHKIIRFLGILLLSSMSFTSFALQERHLILIRQGGASALTEEGQQSIKQTAEVLLSHGFDNRSITAVYVAKDDGSHQCANKLVELGLFEANKVFEANDETWPGYVFTIQKYHDKGHIVLIDDGANTSKIIQMSMKTKVDIALHQPYILPFLS